MWDKQLIIRHFHRSARSRRQLAADAIDLNDATRPQGLARRQRAAAFLDPPEVVVQKLSHVASGGPSRHGQADLTGGGGHAQRQPFRLTRPPDAHADRIGPDGLNLISRCGQAAGTEASTGLRRVPLVLEACARIKSRTRGWISPRQREPLNTP